MNILIYTDKSPFGKKRFGGAETSLRLLAEKLAARKHNVIFLSRDKENKLFRIKKDIINNVKVFIVGWKPIPFLDISILRNIRDMVFNYYFDHTVRNILRNYNIMIVCTFYELKACRYFIGLRENKKYKYQFVIRIAGMYWSHMVNKDRKYLDDYIYIYENTDCLNFISSGLYKLFNNALKAMDVTINIKEHFIHDIGVDLIELGKYMWKPNGNKSLNLVMATRFSGYQKRQDILVETINILKDKIPLKLILIGNGDNREIIEEKIKSLGLDGLIEITPFMQQEELWQSLSEADVLCHACDYEGLSKIILESMYIGLPVLVSDVVPLNEYIRDGVNGYLSDNNPEKWADKLLTIYFHRNELIDISENARNFIRNKYDSDKNVDLYISKFSSLVQY